MKIRKLTALLTAATLALTCTGCAAPEIQYHHRDKDDDDDDDYSYSASDNNGGFDFGGNNGGNSNNGNNGGNSGGYDNEDRDYTYGATQLSLSNGNLSIHRRERENTVPMGSGNWTILVYMCGSDLESGGNFGTSDLFEMLDAQYSENVNVVIQTGGSTSWYENIVSSSSIERWVKTSDDIVVADEQPDANMGDPDTLADFVKWGAANYPAEHMGLVFWDHGGGSISGVCFDEKNRYDSLSLREIDMALNSAFDSMTDKFEFIGFDACLMSTLETANILVPYARYMYASQEVEPGSGWNYTTILSALAQNPGMDGVSLGKIQCDSYRQTCADEGNEDIVTFAVTDLSKIDNLVTSFNRTAQQLYESDRLSDIAREISWVDNFGGNNNSEGFTNMVDMKGMLNSVKYYASSAEDALSALNSAVIYSTNGYQHTYAGGLSLYYPLSAANGSEELSIFADICTSPYYLALVDAVAYGTTGGNVDSYNNSDIVDNSGDLWSEDYTPSQGLGSTSGVSYDSSVSMIDVRDIYFDSEGVYTVQMGSMDTFNYATCSLFMMLNGTYIYLGEDDEVTVDYNNMTIKDNFKGSWPSIGGWPLEIITVGVTDDTSFYTAPVLCNGELCYLRIDYDWNAGRWNVLGTWGGIDPLTGAASRDIIPLQYGDKLELVYYYSDGGDADYFTSDPMYVYDSIDITYSALEEGDYDYSMTIYDVYGGYYETPSVTFTCDEYGELYFYPDELR